MKKFVLPLFAVVFMGFAFAHQPRLIFQQPIGQVVQVQNPEISQAFYGILSGQKDVYQIVADTWFLLYVNIVVPDLSWAKTDFAVDLIENNPAIYTRIDGAKYQRTRFFEKFAGDMYFKWPSVEKQVTSGTYTLIVSNPSNEGKYSLAIGKIESFPLNETIKTFKNMPALKMVFFEKSWYTILRNYIWLMVLITITALVILIWWANKLIKYIKTK